jgi:hypothetical protein
MNKAKLLGRGQITQGEWRVGVYETTSTMLETLKSPQACVCRKDDKMLIALCGEADDKDSRADADLIAAAPDLKLALENLVQFFEEFCIFDRKSDYLPDWLHDAKTALAKAEGDGNYQFAECPNCKSSDVFRSNIPLLLHCHSCSHEWKDA